MSLLAKRMLAWYALGTGYFSDDALESLLGDSLMDDLDSFHQDAETENPVSEGNDDIQEENLQAGARRVHKCR